MNPMIKYEAVVEAARCGNLTEAAVRLNYTQPGISHMIKSLETQYGFPLFYRSKTGVELTENGKRIYNLYTQMIQLDKEIQDTIYQIQGMIVGTVRVCSYFAPLVKWAPSVVELFSARYPQVEIQLFESELDEMVNLLQNNLADIAIMANGVPSGYRFFPLRADPAVVILPENHPLAQKDDLEPSDLLQYDVLLQHESSAEETELLFGRKYLSIIKPSSTRIIKCDSAIVEMVRKGLGVGIVAKLLVTPAPEGVVVRTLNKPYARTLGLAVSPQKIDIPAIRKFIDTFCELYQDETLRVKSALLL